MSRYCKKQGQVLSDMHWCETCPQIKPDWKALYEEERQAHSFTRELLQRYNTVYNEVNN